jgi:hypothetical protein
MRELRGIEKMRKIRKMRKNTKVAWLLQMLGVALFGFFTASPLQAQQNTPYKGGRGDGYSAATLILKKNQQPSAVLVAPNPIAGGQRLTISENVIEVRCFDQLGRQIQVMSERREPFSWIVPFPPGIYFLRLRTAAGWQTRRLVVL